MSNINAITILHSPFLKVQKYLHMSLLAACAGTSNTNSDKGKTALYVAAYTLITRCNEDIQFVNVLKPLDCSLGMALLFSKTSAFAEDFKISRPTANKLGNCEFAGTRMDTVSEFVNFWREAMRPIIDLPNEMKAFLEREYSEQIYNAYLRMTWAVNLAEDYGLNRKTDLAKMILQRKE